MWTVLNTDSEDTRIRREFYWNFLIVQRYRSREESHAFPRRQCREQRRWRKFLRPPLRLRVFASTVGNASSRAPVRLPTRLIWRRKKVVAPHETWRYSLYEQPAPISADMPWLKQHPLFFPPRFVELVQSSPPFLHRFGGRLIVLFFLFTPLRLEFRVYRWVTNE